jgi:hypothetical protein
MVVTIRKYTAGSNFSAVIDELSSSQHQAGSGRYKIVQVHHRTTALPKKCVHFAAAISRRADDLAAGIYVAGHTASVALNGAEVLHHSVAPEKRMHRDVIRSSGESYNLARII